MRGFRGWLAIELMRLALYMAPGPAHHSKMRQCLSYYSLMMCKLWKIEQSRTVWPQSVFDARRIAASVGRREFKMGWHRASGEPKGL